MLGDKWNEAVVPYKSNEFHQIFIQGTRGKNVQSDIVSKLFMFLIFKLISTCIRQ